MAGSFLLHFGEIWEEQVFVYYWCSSFSFIHHCHLWLKTIDLRCYGMFKMSRLCCYLIGRMENTYENVFIEQTVIHSGLKVVSSIPQPRLLLVSGCWVSPGSTKVRRYGGHSFVQAVWNSCRVKGVINWDLVGAVMTKIVNVENAPILFFYILIYFLVCYIKCSWRKGEGTKESRTHSFVCISPLTDIPTWMW